MPWPNGAGSDLYAVRESLGVVGRAYLALAYGSTDPSDPRVPALLDGLRDEVVISATGAHWESADSLSWATDTVATAVGSRRAGALCAGRSAVTTSRPLVDGRAPGGSLADGLRDCVGDDGVDGYAARIGRSGV